MHLLCVHHILQSWLKKQVTNICPLHIGHTASSSQKAAFGIPHHTSTWSGSRDGLWTWVITKSDTDNPKRHGQWRLSPSCFPCKSQWLSTVFWGRPDRLKKTFITPIPPVKIHTSYDKSLLSSVGVLAPPPDELRRLWHYLFFCPLWFLCEKAKWIMPGLRFPREVAVFGTHDFKLVPSTLWWLMACDPLWFMASRRHYFLGCKSWTACFPHQLPTVTVSASSTLSGMLAIKEGNGEMGERIKEKACSITDLLLI